MSRKEEAGRRKDEEAGGFAEGQFTSSFILHPFHEPRAIGTDTGAQHTSSLSIGTAPKLFLRLWVADA